MGLAVGVEQMGKGGLLGAGGKGDRGPQGLRADRPLRLGDEVEGVLGTGLMPGVFAQAGMEYAYEHDGVGFEQFAKVAEKNHAHSTLNPLAQYQKEFSLDEVMDAEMMAYPNTLLMCCPNTATARPRSCSCREEKLRTLSKEQQQRAVKISRVGADHRPVDRARPGAARRQHAHAQRGRRRRTRRRASTRRTSTSSSCTTASRPPSSSTTTTCSSARRARPASSSTSAARGATARSRSTSVGGLISKGHPIGATGIANVYEVATHLRGEAGDRQIEGATVGLTHVIGLGSACAVHVLEKATV